MKKFETVINYIKFVIYVIKDLLNFGLLKKNGYTLKSMWNTEIEHLRSRQNWINELYK